MTRVVRLLLVGLCLCVPSLASAQSTVVVSDTGKATWTASPDQNATFGTPATPVLTSYKADLYLKSQVTFNGSGVATGTSGSPALSFDWGKGTPDASNTIAGPNIKPLIQPNVEYVLFISAVGPGGSTRSASGTAPFGFPGPPRAVLVLLILP